MKHLSMLLSFFSAIVLLASCNGAGGFLTASSAANEVVVVMDDDQWKSETGRALFDVLNSPAKGLPQREANFRIIQISPENFTSTFKMARNIVIPEISNIYSAPKFTSELDKYAVGQVIVSVKAPDSTSFKQFLTSNTENIVNYIVQKELERNANWLIKDSGTPQTRIQEVFGININYPKGIPNITEHPNFYWATNNSAESRQDVVIYQFPYTSEKVFEKDSLIAIRNRVLGDYIKGSFNSQMTTAVASYTPDYRRFQANGFFRAELRGLWEMTSDMMGGPFVMQAFVNPNTNKVVIVETFVYAPEKKKRNLIRNLEAALYTIRIPEIAQNKN